MAISYISGSNENINGGTIVNLGKDIDNNKNWISSSSNPENIGSVVVNNDHVNPADSSGIFAHNNSKPISKLYTKSLSGIDKSINGSISINNDTKIIRSSLVATAIRDGDYNVFTGQFTASPTGIANYLCPDNSIGECFQDEPPEVFIDIPYFSSGGELEQNGIWLRFRPMPDSVNALYEDWRTIYVPTSSLITSSGVSEGINEGDPDSNSTFKEVNLDQVLPNGTYQIEYDTTVNHDDSSKDFVGRIKSYQTVTNSNLSRIFEIKLSGPEPPPPLQFDPDGDGIGNYINPLLPMELQMQQFERLRDNQSNLDGYFNDILNGTYILCTTENPITGQGTATIEIPGIVEFTDVSTGITGYENFNLIMTIHTLYDAVVDTTVTIGSYIPRNGNQTALSFEVG